MNCQQSANKFLSATKPNVFLNIANSSSNISNYKVVWHSWRFRLPCGDISYEKFDELLSPFFSVCTQRHFNVHTKCRQWAVVCKVFSVMKCCQCWHFSDNCQQIKSIKKCQTVVAMVIHFRFLSDSNVYMTSIQGRCMDVRTTLCAYRGEKVWTMIPRNIIYQTNSYRNS